MPVRGLVGYRGGMDEDDLDLRLDDLALRRATDADAPAIQATLAADPSTWALLEGAPLRADEAQYVLADRPPGVPPERKAVYVADDACVLDLLRGFPDPDIWYLGLIFLTPARRGAGLGTRVIQALAREVRARGGAALRLAVVVENVAARRLYDRLGFMHVARRTRPTASGSHEVDVMELDLRRMS